MATQNPQRFELGDTLKRARIAAGLSRPEAEARLRWYAGKAARVELGTRIPVAAEIEMLADLYKIPQDDRPTLHLLADSARKRESPARVADFAQTYLTLERGATEIRYYDTELVCGLLQTADYARAVLVNSRTQHIEERLADRVARQKILTGDSPVRLRAVLGEAALYRQIGGPNVLREQLAHLIAASALPNVSVRILPFASGAHRALGVGFAYVRLESPALTRVYIEGLTDATYIDEVGETQVYAEDYEGLWAAALHGSESATMLRMRIDSLTEES